MILHFILMHLHGILLTATAMVGVGAGEAGAALSESGEGGGEVESVSEGEGESGEVTDAEGSEGETEGTDQTTETEPTTTPGKVDLRTISPEVKAHLQELQKSNPKLANQIQNALYTSSNFLRAFPGGLKEVQGLKTSIEEMGGIDEIKNLSRTYKYLVEDQEALDNKAKAGDVSVLDTLEETAGEGFFKLIPEAMARWANKDKEGYNHQISKIFVSAMRDGGMVSNLNMAFKLLKLGTPEAIKEASTCLNACADWANNINTLANKVPEKPKIDPAIEQQTRDLDARRTKLFNDEFSASFGSWRNKQINEEVIKLAAGRKLNDYQMNTLGQRVIDDIKDILVADPDYSKAMKRIYDARDMAELQKFARARTMKLLPEITKKAYRALFSAGIPAKKAVKQVSKPGSPGTGPAPTVKGWTKIKPEQAPKPTDIDDRKTDFPMKFRKQAILKNGSKVYWGDKVPV